MTSARFHGGDSPQDSATCSPPESPPVPEVVHHLASAMSGHVRRLHFQGIPVPREVEELAGFLHRLARARQESPPVAIAMETRHYSRMPDQLLITKGEAAERLGVSIRTLERLVATGRLPQVHVERLARFRVKDLESYVEGLTESRSDLPDRVDGDPDTHDIASDAEMAPRSVAGSAR